MAKLLLCPVEEWEVQAVSNIFISVLAVFILRQ